MMKPVLLPRIALLAAACVVIGGCSTTPRHSGGSGTAHTDLQSILDQADGNPYLEDRIHSTIRGLDSELRSGHFRTKLVNTTPDELLRGIDRTQAGDSILAVDYGIDWEGSEFNPYLLANLQAASRGVRIVRVFIVSQKTASRALCRVMKRQADAGIAVRIADQDALKGKAEYQRDTHARVLFQYKTGQSVLMLETVPFPELKLGDPYLLEVTWDRATVQQSERYLTWLAQPDQSSPFNAASCL